MRNDDIIERPVDQTKFTQRYTEEAVKFIRSNKDRPFFLYMAHNMPHVPLFVSSGFRGQSLRGLYGDVVEEIDWSVGRIRAILEEEGIAEQTLVIFTSDNGPWLVFRDHGGSAGMLRDGKGTTWEGGMRVPAVFYWPERIKSGVVTDMGTTMDLFTTILLLAGINPPEDRVIDGLDLSPVLFGTGASPRQLVFYYRGTKVFALRRGPFKAHFITKSAWARNLKETVHDSPLLYHLDRDPSERFDISERYPEIVEEIRQELTGHLQRLVPAESQLRR
jgi:arylsulfatase A-like enzyme